MNCNGTEFGLLECLSNGIGVHDCGHSEDAGVLCQLFSTVTPSTGSGGGPDNRECFTDGEFNSGILTYNYDGLVSSLEGPIEICVDGRYESVCDIGWDEVDALAFCRYQYGSNVGKCCSRV